MHLGADKFDGDLDDLFQLQDDVATRVVGAIAPRLRAASLNDTKKRAPEVWDAYDHYLRGSSLLHHHQTPDAVRRVHRCPLWTTLNDRQCFDAIVDCST